MARATNKFHESPERRRVARSPTARVTPNVVTGGIGFYEQDNGQEHPVLAEVHQHLQRRRQPPAPLRRRRRGHRLPAASPAAPARPSPCRTAPRRRPAPSIQILPDPPSAQIYRVTRANSAPAARPRSSTTQLLPPGHLADRQAPDPPSRHPLEQQKLHGQRASSRALPVERATSRPATSATARRRRVPCEFTLDNNWGPRLGATYDITGNGKSKLFASWGRFYAKIPNDLAARALSADAGVTRADYFDAGLTRPVPERRRSPLGTTNHLTASRPASPPSSTTDVGSHVLRRVRRRLRVRGRRRASTSASATSTATCRGPRGLSAAAQVVLYDLGVPARSVEYFIDNINAEHADAQPRGLRAAVRAGPLRGPGPQVPRGRAHRSTRASPTTGR